MENKLVLDEQYKVWLHGLKEKVHQSQIKAAVSVNRALLEFYWQLGADIVEKQKSAAWGSGFVKQLSHDLLTEFPTIRGFSERNIKYIRQWFLFWSTAQPIRQQAVAQLNMEPIDVLTQVPWGHNIVIVVRRAKALFFSGCESRPVTFVPTGSNRSRRGGNESSEASGVEGSSRNLANMQAVM